MLHNKTCIQCLQPYETPRSDERFCSGLCKDNFKRDEKVNAWIHARPRKPPGPTQSFHIRGEGRR